MAKKNKLKNSGGIENAYFEISGCNESGANESGCLEVSMGRKGRL